MGKRLNDNLTSGYFEAANRLNSKQARRRIVAYVESYDDIFFWRTVLSQLETDRIYFEVMLPSRDSKLKRGKKAAMMSMLSDKVGGNMIACIDADYDYLLQGITPTSRAILSNPYVFHTYAYAIENLQCYAPSLRNVVVSVVLNDHNIFDFEAFMQRYSEIIYPLFVWNIWYYRSTHYSNFTMTQFNHAIEMGEVDINAPQHVLAKLAKKVGRMVQMLQAKNEAAWEEYHQVAADLKRLGVTPRNTYLYIHGHHLFENVVVPLLTRVCNRLYREQERAIQRQAKHNLQLQSEMAGYQHRVGNVELALRKNTNFRTAPQYQQIIEQFKTKEQGIASISMKTTKVKDVRQWLNSADIKKNIAFLKDGLNNLKGIDSNKHKMFINSAEIHIYMPKENITDDLLKTWEKELSKKTGETGIKFEIRTLEDFVK